MKIVISSDTERELQEDLTFENPKRPQDGRCRIRLLRAHDLLNRLRVIDGPELHIEYSFFGFLRFSADAGGLTLAEVELLPKYYQVSYPLPRELRRGTVKRWWYHGEEYEVTQFHTVVGIAPDAAAAAKLLLEAIEASGCNPDRIGAQWKWYICPKCDLHAPQYSPRCVRCDYAYPSERKAQLFGMYRTAGEPQGCKAPRKPTA